MSSGENPNGSGHRDGALVSIPQINNLRRAGNLEQFDLARFFKTVVQFV